MQAKTGEGNGVSRGALRAFDIGASALLAVLAVWLRLPYRAAILYEHDSFLFARAMERYDLASGQPHPPGYIFYVYLAKMVDAVAHDPNGSLLWVNIGFGAAACVLVYWLGCLLGGRLAGLAAGLLFLTSPLVWFHSEVAIVYIVEGALAAAVALLVWQVARGKAGWILPSGLLLGAAGGFRPWVTLFLLPLWVIAAARHGGRRTLEGAAGVVVGTLAWYVPNAVDMGGPGAYNRLVLGYGGPAMAEGLAARVHWASLAPAGSLIWNWVWSGLGWALLGIVYLVVRGAWRRGAGPVKERDWAMLGQWVAPALVFYLLVHAARPGYVLTFLPGLAVFAAVGLRAAADDAAAGAARLFGTPRSLGERGVAWMVYLVICAPLLTMQTGAFLYGKGPFSHPVIQAQVTVVSERIEFVKARFAPEETVVLASEWAAFARYYLEGYQVFDATFDTVAAAPEGEAGGALEAANVVLFDFKLNAYNESAEQFAVERLPVSGLPIAYAHLGPGERLVVRPERFWIEQAEARAALP